MRDPKRRHWPRFAAFALATCAAATHAQAPPPPSQPPMPPAPPAEVLRQVEDFAPADEFVMVGPVKTHVVRRGTTGLPIVLIHGFGSNTYSWRKNVEVLGRTHRVFALDLKGFGLTAKPKDGRYNLYAYTEHLLAFLDTMGLRRSILVGNSMGGAVACRLALEHPERVAGLVLVDAALPTWMLGPGTNRPAAGVDPGAVAPSPLKAALLKSLITRERIEGGLRGSFHDPKLVTPEMVEAYYRPITIEGAAEAFAAMATPLPLSPVPPLKDLKCPTVVVWGRHDRVLPLATSEAFSEIPGVKRVVFDDSGHLPHEEEPDRFNALVADFAAGLK